MTSRMSTISRKTKETEISLTINLDGSGTSSIDTGIGFFDHMLEQIAKHASMDITLNCVGDLHIDNHHLVEDIGICFGKAFREALGNCAGIERFHSMQMPMDEALISLALDINGRGNPILNFTLPSERVGTFETETLREFLISFCNNGMITLHVNMMYGTNTHHIIEGIFKGLAVCLGKGVQITKSLDTIPSTKGLI